MPERWLQVKGDPSVRQFLFAQQRVESLFDQQIDLVHAVVLALLTRKGVFHVKIHYSSSQLTCWFCDDAYRYRVYVRDEVLEDHFLDHFRDLSVDHLKPLLHVSDIAPILDEFKRLRLTDETILSTERVGQPGQRDDRDDLLVRRRPLHRPQDLLRASGDLRDATLRFGPAAGLTAASGHGASVAASRIERPGLSAAASPSGAPALQVRLRRRLRPRPRSA